MESDIYIMRAYALADCLLSANAIANKYIKQLSGFCDIRLESLERYWKKDIYFEILMTVSVPAHKKALLQGLLNAIGSEPKAQKKGEYIWNSEEGSVFRISETKWVHLEPSEPGPAENQPKTSRLDS